MPATPARLKKKSVSAPPLSYRLSGMTALATGLAVLASTAFAQSAPPAAPAAAKPAASKPAVLPLKTAAAPPKPKPVSPKPISSPSAPPNPAPVIDEQPLWTLYNTHQYAELKARVAEIRKKHPSWTPSPALADAMLGAELRQEFDTDAAHRNWRGADALKTRYPNEFDCAHVENIWALADVDIAAGRKADALALYHGILDKCTDEHDRIVTIERFGPAGNYDEAYQLLGLEASRVTVQKDMDALAAAVSELDIQHLTSLVYGGRIAQAKAMAPRLAPAIVASHNVVGVTALGWLEMKQHHPEQALPWFTRAMTWEPGAPTAANLALAYLQAGRLDQAAALAARYPGSPLFLPIRRAVAVQRAETAYRAGRFDEVVAIADAADRQGAGSVDLSLARAWSLYVLGRPDAADSFIAIAGANEGTPKIANQAAVGLLYALLKQCPGGGPILPTRPFDLTDPAATLPPAPTDNATAAADCVDQAIDRRSSPEVERILDLLQSRLLGGMPDPQAAIAFGWYKARLGDLDTSISWFGRALEWARDPGTQRQAKTGYATVLLQAKRYDEIRALLVNDQHDPVYRPIYAEALRGLAREAQGEKRYIESNDLLRQAMALTPPRREDMMLMAWNDYALHDYATAGATFRSLYAGKQDQESAQGLVLTAQATKDLHSLDGLSGPVHPLLMDAYGDQAVERRQYIRALSFAPTRYPQLLGLDLPTASVDILYRDKSGTAGQGKLYGPTVTLAQTLTLGIDQWRFSLGLSDWSSGSPQRQSIAGLPASALTRADLAAACGGSTISKVGSLGCPAFSPLGRTGLVAEPQVSWLREGESFRYLAALGTTPLNGLAAPTLTAKFHATWIEDNGGSIEGGIDRASNRESILAFSGQRDPATGGTWGRVVENAINLSTSQPLVQDWTATGALELGELDGVQVQRNRKIKLSASAQKNVAILLDPADFSVISIGPAFSYEAFQRNLSGFTTGQGGYFSPQSFARLGAAFNFETKPIGRLVARGGGFLGWQKTREGSSQDYFYAPTAQAIYQPGRHSSKFGADVYGDLSYLVLPWMMVDAGISYDQMPDYNEWRTLVGLEIPIGGPRKAATLDDLPDVTVDDQP